MRMVVKNKEEGTELFKGGNYRPAAARYHKALTHASKFFDLSPDDEKEVKAVKLSLYLNLAQCYIKLENYDNVIRNCDEALSLEPKNAKALFRRAFAYETKKDWDRALDDLKNAAESNPDDMAIPKVYTHTYIYIYIHTFIRTNIYTYMHTYTGGESSKVITV